jgi:hypothetical protein
MVAGCPPKYTPERLKSILQDISDRIPYEFAAEANGIRESTLYAWINQGKDEQDAGLDTPLARFSEDLKRIEAKKIKHHLEKIDANIERWQGDAWILERRFHKHFGANVQVRDLEDRVKKLHDDIAAKEKEKANGQEAQKG